PELDQQALLQVTGTDPGGIETLDDFEDIRYLVLFGNDILGKRQIVYQGRYRSPEVTIIIQATDNLLANQEIPVRQGQQVELLLQVLKKRILDGYGYFLAVVF